MPTPVLFVNFDFYILLYHANMDLSRNILSVDFKILMCTLLWDKKTANQVGGTKMVVICLSVLHVCTKGCEAITPLSILLSALQFLFVIVSLHEFDSTGLG